MSTGNIASLGAARRGIDRNPALRMMMAMMKLGWRRIGAWLGLCLTLVACGATLFTIQITREATTFVEGGTVIEALLGDFGLSDFIAMDITSAQEIVNQGVEPGDINEVRLTLFELEVSSPDEGDLSFIERLDLFVEAPNLPRVRIAWQDTFPSGVNRVSFNYDDVDLTDYVVSEALTLTTETSGTRPDGDHTLIARFTLDVAVTLQGAWNAAVGD